MANIKDLTLLRFGEEGEILPLKDLGSKVYNDTTSRLWLFRCTRCGFEFEKLVKHIKGNKSCGETFCRKYYNKKIRRK